MINLDEYVLYHAAIVRYVHERDKDSIELQLLRMRAVINFYDLDGDGILQLGEIHELVREMCMYDGHVDYIMGRLGIDLGKSVTTEKLLNATANGIFRKANLFTRDLLSQKHFSYAVRLTAPAPADATAGGAQTAAAAAAAGTTVAITEQASLLIELGLLKFDPPGEPAERQPDADAIYNEFQAIAAADPTKKSTSAQMSRAAFVGCVRQRYPGGLIHGRLAEACFKAFDMTGSGTIGLLEYLLFHAAVLRYDHDRDAWSLGLQRLRMATVTAIYDLNRDGVLEAGEVRELVRDLCIGTRHNPPAFS